jgi:hypothetical protein
MGRKSDEQFCDAEAARRRDEVIKHMLNTPPQPRNPKAETSKSRTKRVREKT